jgi:hypothetical protein
MNALAEKYYTPENNWSRSGYDEKTISSAQYVRMPNAERIRPNQPPIEVPIKIGSEDFKIIVSGGPDGNLPEPFQETIKQLQLLANFPEDWNSYGGRRLGRGPVLRITLEILVKIFERCLLPSQISLTSDGGIEMLWTKDGAEFEATVRHDGSIEAGYFGEEEIEWGIGEALNSHSLASHVIAKMS